MLEKLKFVTTRLARVLPSSIGRLGEVKGSRAYQGRRNLLRLFLLRLCDMFHLMCLVLQDIRLLFELNDRIGPLQAMDQRLVVCLTGEEAGPPCL